MSNIEFIALCMAVLSVSSLAGVILFMVHDCIWSEKMVLKEFIKCEKDIIDNCTRMLNEMYRQPDTTPDKLQGMFELIKYHEFVKLKMEELLKYRKAFDTILYRVDLDRVYFEEHYPNKEKSKECQEELDRVKGIIREYLDVDVFGEEDAE